MKTIKVRVAVAIDPTGAWNASGWSGDTTGEAMSLACEGVEDGEARYWLVAELPIPECAEVQAQVEPE